MFLSHKKNVLENAAVAGEKTRHFRGFRLPGNTGENRQSRQNFIT